MPELTNKQLATGAIAIGGVALLYALGKKLNLWGTTGPTTDFGIDAEDVTGTPTLTRQAARMLADTIYAAIYGDGSFWSGQSTEDEAAVIRAITSANNDADVLLIVQEYGIRTGGWSSTGELSLVQAVQQYLSRSDIAEINAAFAAKGIQIRF